jgi:hypothetical protein
MSPFRCVSGITALARKRTIRTTTRIVTQVTARAISSVPVRSGSSVVIPPPYIMLT